MSGVNVKSEIKPLKKVLLHRPGKELLNLTPNTLEELLFDDIPFLKVAQEEHDAFAQALRDNGVEVFTWKTSWLRFSRPTRAARAVPQAVDRRGRHPHGSLPEDHLRLPAGELPRRRLVLKTMEGINLTELHTDKSNSLVDLVSESSKMVIKPMPNLYFTPRPVRR